VLALAPGSGAREKNWPEENFVEVARWWRHTARGDVLALLGPVEQERGGVERLKQCCLVARGLTLAQAAAFLQRSDLYLGNDSGLSHLAAAAGTPSVVLFGPSNPQQWAPRGKHVTVLRRQMACSPCAIATMKSCPHRACLTEFWPRQVIGSIASLAPVVTLTRVEAGIKV
jgi:ADP-heptose:LPS heptosyltransferase